MRGCDAIFNSFVRTKWMMHVKWGQYVVLQEAYDHDGHSATAGPAAFASQTSRDNVFVPVTQAVLGVIADCKQHSGDKCFVARVELLDAEALANGFLRFK